MVKLFATDLDGTLLKKGRHIAPDDIAALHTLEDHHIDFAIATGRMDREIMVINEQIKLNGHRVSQNGAFTLTNKSELIYQKTFDINTSKKIHLEVMDFPNPYCISTADEIFVSKITEDLKHLEGELFFPLKEGVDFLDKYGDSFLPSKFMLFGETDELVAYQKNIMQDIADVAETYISDPHCLDIVPKGVSKSLGLRKLAEHLQIDPTEIAVIGDSFNDLPMFQMTPHSFAMATAPKEVQNHATYVVDSVKEAVELVTQKVSAL
ncbi:hypothetical protein GGQ92_002334 [Gracilibacillus halotolerans]|uniref:Cof-type HAD-IIB family hydrolase n=1 Tax=Gracilibacillus halotolerans TaxID=74386 RepID=A0A841RNR9_9BACI|nr:HAD family hydrolase [Gracilibacillus halotolerans]MBB6513522.1 hypothetical protein [Gracilibacillus halotolerans]